MTVLGETVMMMTVVVPVVTVTCAALPYPTPCIDH